MISKKDIDYVASWELKSERACHPSHRTAVIQLSLLRELRQQLKDKFKTSIYNYDEAEQFINDVLCVEGEKNE